MSAVDKAPRIEAAGVVLVREGAGGPEIAVVHRPHRSDWSLPKGKLLAGERHEVAAVREVREETGASCVLGPFLGTRRYHVDGVPKQVSYWRASVRQVQLRLPDGEVDDVRWLTRRAAKELLTYDDDRVLVDRALALPETVATVVLRHAEATKRAVWRDSGDPQADDDTARPLTAQGSEQAVRLGDLLACFGPRRVISSPARRCVDTVTPFVSNHGLPLRLDESLSERGCSANPTATGATVARLLETGGPDLWCTHRPVLPIALGAVARHLRLDPGDDRLDPRLAPGAALVLHRDLDGQPIAVDRLTG